jgi:hypothetical protein
MVGERLQKLSTRSHGYYRPLTCEPHIHAGLHPTVAPTARSCTTKDTPGELQSLRTPTAGTRASHRATTEHPLCTHTHPNSVSERWSRRRANAHTSTCNGPRHKSGTRHSPDEAGHTHTHHVGVSPTAVAAQGRNTTMPLLCTVHKRLCTHPVADIGTCPGESVGTTKNPWVGASIRPAPQGAACKSVGATQHLCSAAGEVLLPHRAPTCF